MSDFIPNRLTAGNTGAGQFTYKTNSESDLELESDMAKPLEAQREELIESVDDAVDDAIRNSIKTVRDHEGMDMYSVGFDRDGMTKGLTDAINDLDEDQLGRCKYSEGGLDLRAVLEEEGQYGSVSGFLNAHYYDPDELADDWQRKNFCEDGIAVNTAAWFENNIAQTDTGTSIDDIDNWDVEGASEAIDQHLMNVARGGDLSMEAGVEDVLDESFWTDLSERFCKDPDED